MPHTSAQYDWLEELYNEHYSMLYRLVCRKLYAFTGSTRDAADIIQDVFLVAARKKDRLCSHPKPAGWLVKTSVNLCKDYQKVFNHRKHGMANYKSLFLQHQPMEYGPLYTGAQDDTAVQNLLISLEQALSAEDYAIVRAYCLERRSIQDISQCTGLSETALRVRIHRIRKILSEIFIFIVIFSMRAYI